MKNEIRPHCDLSDSDKLQLAREVFDSVYNDSESFREYNLGSDLSYILGAIIDREYSTVDWSTPCCEVTLNMFKRLFPEHHQVWNYIIFTR